MSRLLAIPWTAAHQAPLSMEISRQEYWTGLPFPPPGDLPNPEIESESSAPPALQVDSLVLTQQLSELNSIFLLYKPTTIWGFLK